MASLRHRALTAWLHLSRPPRGMAQDLAAGVDGIVGPPRRLAGRFARFEHEGHAVYVAEPLELSGRSGAPRVLYLHGGGFVYGLNAVHFAAAARLADMAGAEVWLPEHPLPPAALAEAVTAWTDGLLGRAMADGPLVLMGDSAGGGLALGAAQRRVGAGRAVPERLMLLSPWADLTMTHEALPAADRTEPLIALDVLRDAGRRYAGPLDVVDPLVSPLRGAMAGLPPTTIHAGGRDLLYSDSVRLAEALRGAGVRTELIARADLGHYWMFYPVPEARGTWDEVAAWARSPAKPTA